MKSKYLLLIVLMCCLGITFVFTFNTTSIYSKKSLELAKSIHLPGNTGSHSTINNFQILAPIQYYNLQIFPLIHSTTLNEKSYLTLSEAMTDSLVAIKETGEVNNLSISNNSSRFVYIQSGDIIKGGKQDRTLQYDVLIKPKAQNVSISSFCVESGRWTNRGDENVAYFASSYSNLSSKELRLSAKKSGSQSHVWAEVKKEQKKLTNNISSYFDSSISVQSDLSNSSLQLTLENEALDSLKKLYLNELRSLVQLENVTGFAYAVNGQLFGIELYNNKMLFDDLKEKILESFVVEAIGLRDSFNHVLCTQDQLFDVIKLHGQTVLSKKENSIEVNKETRFNTLEFEQYTEFITFDITENNWLHVNFIEDSGKTNMSQEDLFFHNGQRIAPSETGR